MEEEFKDAVTKAVDFVLNITAYSNLFWAFVGLFSGQPEMFFLGFACFLFLRWLNGKKD